MHTHVASARTIHTHTYNCTLTYTHTHTHTHTQRGTRKATLSIQMGPWMERDTGVSGCEREVQE